MAVDYFIAFNEPPPITLIPPEFRMPTENTERAQSLLFQWLPGELKSTTAERRNVFRIICEPREHEVIDISDLDSQSGSGEEGEISYSRSSGTSESSEGSIRRRNRRYQTYTSSGTSERSSSSERPPPRKSWRGRPRRRYPSSSRSRYRSVTSESNSSRGHRLPPKQTGSRGRSYKDNDTRRSRRPNYDETVSSGSSNRQRQPAPVVSSGLRSSRGAASPRPSQRDYRPAPPPLPATMPPPPPAAPKSQAELTKLKLAAQLGINRGVGTFAEAERDRKRKDEEFRKQAEAKQVIADDILTKRHYAKLRATTQPTTGPANFRGRRGKR